MKKTLFCLLVIFSLVFGAVSCGNPSKDTTNGKSQVNSSVENTGTVDDSDGENENVPEKVGTFFDAENNIEEQEILNYQGITVVAKAIDYTQKTNTVATLPFEVQNTNNISAILHVAYVAINDIVFEEECELDVPASSNEDFLLMFTDREFDYTDIREIKEIEIGFIVAVGDGEKDYLYMTESVTIQTKGSTNYQQEKIETQNVIIDESGIKISYLGMKEDGYIGIYAENNSDSIAHLTITLNNFYDDSNPQKKYYQCWELIIPSGYTGCISDFLCEYDANAKASIDKTPTNVEISASVSPINNRFVHHGDAIQKLGKVSGLNLTP